MVEMKSKKFFYKNIIEWKKQRMGILSAENKPGIEIATPPEFKGHEGIWNPEDLFVASVNACIMTTFLAYAERNKLDFESFKSEAEGVLEIADNKFMITEIKIKPFVKVKHDADIERAKELIGLSEKNCLISNSIVSKVTILPEATAGI
ncbi:MAG: OsmC family protein [Actinobacteria bacterium]|nr:OsmC family protein [Actinomycetota bacterium]